MVSSLIMALEQMSSFDNCIARVGSNNRIKRGEIIPLPERQDDRYS